LTFLVEFREVKKRARSKMSSRKGGAQNHLAVVLKVATQRGASNRDLGRLCESAIPLANSDRQRQLLAFHAADLFDWPDERAIKLFERAARIDGPFTVAAAIRAAFVCINDDQDLNGRVKQPERALRWLEHARALVEPQALTPASKVQTELDYLSVLDGLIYTNAKGRGIRPSKRLLESLTDVVGALGKDSRHQKVRDQGRWLLDKMSFGGCGPVVQARAKQLVESVGRPSNYAQGVAAAI
jgi:hypothetical protein